MFVPFSEIDITAYDVIVVGSGPAGASLALQLEKNAKSVLVFETGLKDYDGDLQDQFSAISGRGHYGGSHWERHWVRAFGGTSSLWGGWCLPLAARTLDSWPISRSDLDPYYRKAVEFLKINSEILDFQTPMMDGFDYRPFSTDPAIRVLEDYGKAFESSTSVHVVLGVSVSELLFDESRNRLTGVSAVSLDQERRNLGLRPEQRLVLAAGAMGNAQIMLNSRNGTDVAVGNEYDQVGRYLMEHPHIYGCARAILPATWRFPERPGKFGMHADALVPSDALYSEFGGVDVSFGIRKVALNSGDSLENFVAEKLVGEGATAFEIDVRAEMPPDPDNRVELDFGQDPAGLPRLRTTCVVPSDTLLRIDNYLNLMGTKLADGDLGRLRLSNDVLYFNIEGGGHTMGTTRMGSNRRSSVVDGNCRVHGFDNLYVAGSSVFATGGFENPTLSIVALAVRLGDHLGGTA